MLIIIVHFQEEVSSFYLRIGEISQRAGWAEQPRPLVLAQAGQSVITVLSSLATGDPLQSLRPEPATATVLRPATTVMHCTVLYCTQRQTEAVIKSEVPSIHVTIIPSSNCHDG